MVLGCSVRRRRAFTWFVAETTFREANVLAGETIGGAWEAHLSQGQSKFRWHGRCIGWRVTFTMVEVILEDGFASITAIHDVVESTGIFDAQLASHAPRLPRPAIPSIQEVVEVRN